MATVTTVSLYPMFADRWAESAMADASAGNGLLLTNFALLGHVRDLLDISKQGRLPYQNRRMVPRGGYVS